MLGVVPLPRADQAHASTWIGLGYVTSISMFLAFAPWYAARGGIALTSQLQLLQPLLSVCWATWILGEATSARLWITLALVIGSIVWSRRAPVRGAPASSSGESLKGSRVLAAEAAQAASPSGLQITTK